ncbi:MAG: hypothetical protein NWE85_04895 [Candidatus Bathyarchaeota archaeon]|nr:hypothetical protein [Candidatus Bathyarchaeota archaeon]
MPVSSALVTRFFQLLVNRRFAEGERELERIKEKMHKTEWNRGYFRALYGMLIARKSNNDNYAFLSKLDFNDKNVLQNYRKEFRGHVKSKLHGDFDRGFFSAWAKFMRILSKLAMDNSEAKSVISEKAKSKIVEKDKSQAKIESFLRVKA